jgi:hypothetical protein
MKKILVPVLVALLACLALSMPFQPAYAQPVSCDDNTLIDDDVGEPPCLLINPFCRSDHPDLGTAVDCVNDAIAGLGGDCDPGILDIPEGTPEWAAAGGNCGPGLIIEDAVACMNSRGMGGAPGLLLKTWGNECNGHSVDVVVFDDGCAFDVIIGSGACGQSGGIIDLCCGEPPCQTQGCCTAFLDRYIPP